MTLSNQCIVQYNRTWLYYYCRWWSVLTSSRRVPYSRLRSEYVPSTRASPNLTPCDIQIYLSFPSWHLTSIVFVTPQITFLSRKDVRGSCYEARQGPLGRRRQTASRGRRASQGMTPGLTVAWVYLTLLHRRTYRQLLKSWRRLRSRRDRWTALLCVCSSIH